MSGEKTLTFQEVSWVCDWVVCKGISAGILT